MYKKVLKFIREHNLLVQGERVAVGLSGGADSVCLLVILKELKAELNIELMAVHVHHGLRGAEADRDSEYARELSEFLGVPFICVHANVKEYARVHRKSEEEAGRYLRYRILEEQRERGKAEKIAVAHHADDQTETILYNLFRGSGLKGLGGIQPMRDRIIRPLLSVTKKEIFAYLKEKEISYCEDSTNSKTDYIRNRLRHEIIPAVKDRINAGACSHILQASRAAAAADAYFEKAAARILECGAIYDRGEDSLPAGMGISAKMLAEEDSIIRRYVIRRMMRTVLRSLKDIASIHAEEAERLLFKPAGRRIQLPQGGYALRTYDDLWIKSGKKRIFVENIGKETEEAPVMTIFPYKKEKEIPKNRYTKWFDYDKINSTLSVRHRETGDYITLSGGGRKTVKAFMIDEKIPRGDRDKILLAADGSHVLWIIGYRISEYYKITEETHTVLQIQMDRGESDEG